MKNTVGKDKLQIGRRYLQITYLTNDLYPEHIKNFQHSGVKKKKKTNQKTPNPVTKLVKDLIRNFTKGDIWKSISIEEMPKIISY